MSDGLRISSIDADGLRRALPDFAEILRACVEAGASVGFILPFPQAEATAFWRETVLPPLQARRRILLAAAIGDRYVGTVQLIHDTPPNQPHRAEVAKLLVHPDARRQGVARALMTVLEAQATALNRSLLTLDTRSGDPAQALYASLGYRVAGEIPNWCRDTASDRLDPTTLMYKSL